MIYEGHLVDSTHKFAIVVARFNSFITDKLVEGALDTIERHGGKNHRQQCRQQRKGGESNRRRRKYRRTRGKDDRHGCSGGGF